MAFRRSFLNGRNYYFHSLVAHSTGFTAEYNDIMGRYTVTGKTGTYNDFQLSPLILTGPSNRYLMVWESNRDITVEPGRFTTESTSYVGQKRTLVGYWNTGQVNQWIHGMWNIGDWITKLHIEKL